MNLDRVVLLYLGLLNDCRWLVYLDLKVVPDWPIYVAICVLDLTSALYTTPSTKHFPPKGQADMPPLQLHSNIFGFVESALRILLLCPEIIASMFGRHE